MSRQIVYNDSRLSVVQGVDHALGQFWQVFDKNMVNETPEGEGLVLDWSELFGFETNLTGYPNNTGMPKLVFDYIEEFGDVDDEDIN
jgi:hypothetical protein